MPLKNFSKQWIHPSPWYSDGSSKPEWIEDDYSMTYGSKMQWKKLTEKNVIQVIAVQY
jgi:hypothetical protein